MSRPPRELLLSRYSDAAPRLEARRRAALAEARPVPARELLSAVFLPQRRLWLGLAAFWVVILALNLTPSPAPQPDSKFISYALRRHAAAQAQLYALLTTTPSLH